MILWKAFLVLMASIACCRSTCQRLHATSRRLSKSQRILRPSISPLKQGVSRKCSSRNTTKSAESKMRAAGVRGPKHSGRKYPERVMSSDASQRSFGCRKAQSANPASRWCLRLKSPARSTTNPSCSKTRAADVAHSRRPRDLKHPENAKLQKR